MEKRMTTELRIARELRNARVNAGYTQKQMGLMTGKAPQTVASWECGKAQPNIQTFMFMCKRYGISDIFREFSFAFEDFGDSQLKLGSSNIPYGYEMVGLTAEETHMLKKYRMLNKKTKKLMVELIKSILRDDDGNPDDFTPEEELENEIPRRVR